MIEGRGQGPQRTRGKIERVRFGYRYYLVGRAQTQAHTNKTTPVKLIPTAVSPTNECCPSNKQDSREEPHYLAWIVATLQTLIVIDENRLPTESTDTTVWHTVPSSRNRVKNT